ncbi:Serine carboxypeptidase 1-like protein [Drosera capensis]
MPHTHGEVERVRVRWGRKPNEVASKQSSIRSAASDLNINIHQSDASKQAEHLIRWKKSMRSANHPVKDSWSESTVNAAYSRRELKDDEKSSWEADKISALPGQPEGVNFNQYGGYVTVDKEAGKNLFYYFVEAPESPETKPLVLWLNGGPGCSSLGNGAFEEQGPFRVNSDGETLFLNPYAWNDVANVIFLESPAGVGFSYANTPDIYNDTGDFSTARDAFFFVVRWLDRFPHYKSRDFYVSGESYAGHYVPQLAYLIMRENEKPHQLNKVNLKGIFFGNGCLNNPTDNLGDYDYMWTHALISDRSHTAILSSCDFSALDVSDECNNWLDIAENETGNIDPYDIYVPVCLTSGLSNSSTPGSIDVYDPCIDNYVYNYLNLPEVQAALHAEPTNWSTCSNYNWTDSADSVLPLITSLMANNMRVWIYSGDVDSVVPVTSTRYSLDTLKLPVTTAWYPWYLNSQVGGYVLGYENLTFATVRGAGHEVPTFQPERALALFKSYLSGALPPSS